MIISYTEQQILAIVRDRLNRNGLIVDAIKFSIQINPRRQGADMAQDPTTITVNIIAEVEMWNAALAVAKRIVDEEPLHWNSLLYKANTGAITTLTREVITLREQLQEAIAAGEKAGFEAAALRADRDRLQRQADRLTTERDEANAACREMGHGGN